MQTSAVVLALTWASRVVIGLMLLAACWAAWISVHYWSGIGV